MRILEEAFSQPIDHSLLPDTASKVLFFDIETTGFSAHAAVPYLIGCIYQAEELWKLRQWFLDDLQDEKAMLSSFFDFIHSYTWLIHFNGSSFDIPFLKNRMERHQLDNNFSSFHHLDLYREIKPYKKPLGIVSTKQRDLEEFLDIHRTDHFSGGDLIEVYFEYMAIHKEELYQCLLLHNADDLRGIIFLLPLYGLTRLLKGDFEIEKIEQTETAILFFLKTECMLPASLKVEYDNYLLRLKNQQITVQVSIHHEVLKYFYANYKDYYYLPAEDQAIHKSVAIYVDKAYRRTASQSNCYTKRKSAYLPLKDKSFTHNVFQRAYKEKEYFFEITEAFLQDKDMQKNYLIQLFQI